MKCKIYLLLFFFSGVSAAAELPRGVTIGGFVDTYYAYDLNEPPGRDRAYTTQPARDNEFNVNLAYLEAKIDREKVHGRLALQVGTSVQNNYSAEPNIGTVSGPSLSRNIQEAYAGYRLGGDTWIDAGIMLSHIGVESFISKDNLLYTRSLVADYSPYYETGVRLSSKLGGAWSAQILVLNGWQNISENNTNKAIGTQVVFQPFSTFSLTYNTFFGREAAFRQLHDLIVKVSPAEEWAIQLQADFGAQDISIYAPKSKWSGFSLMARRSLSKTLAVNGRIESFSDRGQVLISTSAPEGFRAWGSSLGVDTVLDENTAWRNEVRGTWADSKVFSAHSGPKKSDGVVVSSVSLAF